MTYVDDLLIVGEKQEQESFLAKLSAQFPLIESNIRRSLMPRLHLPSWASLWSTMHKTTASTCIFPQLTTLSFSNCVEWNKPNHLPLQGTSLVCQKIQVIQSINLWIQQDTSFTEQRWANLLWATPVRPDISFAVKELSRSLQSPTQQNEKQLKHVLRYLKGSLQYTTCLQPPRKRVVEASTIERQAFADSDWAGCTKTRRSTSGASLCLWGVTLATCSRTQATQALSSAEAELYAMGMAIQDALHLQSLLQETKLTQLAKPFELTVYTDSSSGKALASKLGLTRKSKHVQLRFLFMQDLVASGQLKLSKIPSERNPADVLTKYMQASTLHKLLPKLGVMTRAVDSKELLSVISFDGRVSSQPTSSFFIGMLAEEPISSQLVASRAHSRRSLPRSLPPESQEVEQPTPTRFTWSSFRWFSVCSAALLCMPFFFQIFDFKLYGALLSGMMVAVQLCFRISFVLEQVASRTRTAAIALRTLSSVALGSLSTPKSLIRIFLVSFSLGWAALLVQNKSLILSASFAQRASFESSLPSLCLSSFCVTASSPASQRASSAAASMSFSSPASDRASSAASSGSFTHEQAMVVLLNNEAYSLPPALLKHSLSAKILDQELQPLPEELEPAAFPAVHPEAW